MPASPARRPLITANMVTFARLVSMPFVALFIYQGESGQWTALILGTLVGCTDFVDGYLARKHGPTVLGGLMDPIADKVFIAVAYVPYADLGRFPAWAIALLFVRELLVTALRSAYELRGLAMRTSYLAKVKTWVQMMGIGMVWLFMAVERRTLMIEMLAVGAALPLVAMGVFWLVKRRFWRGALVMSGAFVLMLGLYVALDVDQMISATVIGIVAMTWLSGLDYIVGGLRQLRGHGDFGRADASRLVGAIALPCLIVWVMVETAAPAWPLATLLSVELAVGGLDNLLAHHRVAASPLAWNLRQIGAAALLGAALAADAAGVPAAVTWCVAGAAAVSLAGSAREFWRGRDYYLDARLRDKARAAQPGPLATTP